MTVSTAQLMTGNLLHCCNITPCIHLYVSQISERIFICLNSLPGKTMFSFLRANWLVVKWLGEVIGLVSFKIASLKVRLGEEYCRKSQVKIDSK